MFTGLVETTGRVQSIQLSATGKSAQLTLQLPENTPFETKHGDSVAVNGCCLTVTTRQDQILSFDVNQETMAVTNLSAFEPGTVVNLERAMQLGDRLGGHLVSGHIDGKARLDSLRHDADGTWLTVAIDRSLARYCIVKGSICLDGVSLTINAIRDTAEASQVDVMLIPTTLALTHFSDLAADWTFNLEVDLIGKYVERLKL